MQLVQKRDFGKNTYTKGGTRIIETCQKTIETTFQHTGNHPKYLMIIATRIAQTNTAHISVDNVEIPFLPRPSN